MKHIQFGVIVLLVLGLCYSPAQADSEARQTVGRRYTAIPLLNFSSDDGTGYGVRVSLFDYDGQTVPYAKSYSAQAFFTTEGKWSHRLYADFPSFRPGYRLEIEGLYEKEDSANFYGQLNDAEADAYTKAERTYTQNHPQLSVTVIRDLARPWQVRFGVWVGHNEVEPNAVGGLFDLLTPLGAEGGSLFQVNTALRHDTRDNYVNSTSGHLDELYLEYGVGGGGDFNGGLVRFEHRHFLALAPGWLFAYRGLADLTFGDVPFYKEPAIGGSGTVRGEPANRLQGEGRILANAELRWQGIRLSSTKRMYLGALLFFDAGQIFSRDDGPSSDGWRAGYGGGARYIWHSTIVRADYGIAENNTGIYITFSQVF